MCIWNVSSLKTDRSSQLEQSAMTEPIRVEEPGSVTEPVPATQPIPGLMGVFTPDRPWQERLSYIGDMMRDMSSQTDPQKLVAMYGQRIRKLIPVDRSVSLSRRNLLAPSYRITRSDLIDKAINPWKSPDKLPIIEGGL